MLGVPVRRLHGEDGDEIGSQTTSPSHSPCKQTSGLGEGKKNASKRSRLVHQQSVFSLFISGEPYLTSLAFFLHIHAGNRIEGDVVMRIHKDNLRHLPRFPDFFVSRRILSSKEFRNQHRESVPKETKIGPGLDMWFLSVNPSLGECDPDDETERFFLLLALSCDRQG